MTRMTRAGRRALVAALLAAAAAPLAAHAQAGEIAKCVSSSVAKGAVAGAASGIIGVFTGNMRLNTGAAAAYGSQVALTCALNSQVVSRNAVARKLLKQQVKLFEQQTRLFNLERRTGAGDTPGTETELGAGALRYFRFTPADMTTSWFAKLATGPRLTRTRTALEQTLTLKSHALFFTASTADYTTHRYQALIEGAEEANEAALAAEEQAKDARKFADLLEQKMATNAPSAGRALQYSALLEHRRAIDLNHQLRAAIADVRGTADEVSAQASPMSVGRGGGLRPFGW